LPNAGDGSTEDSGVAGFVEGIYVAPRGGARAERVEETWASEGRGLEDDR
jgi:hypothetical protein